jgi:DNA-binding winged helix-turn-helix (wHTH) protein/ABC-type cobalamin/Fe3+-siderophores transport system ATPase subunit
MSPPFDLVYNTIIKILKPIIGKRSMKKSWEDYPENYRQSEIEQIQRAVQSGNCVSVVGLSGSGKSNLLGFLFHRKNQNNNLFWIDGNRAALSNDPNILIQLIIKAMGGSSNEALLDELMNTISDRLEDSSLPLGLIIDRFDAFDENMRYAIASQLRFLRDTFKYQLSYIFGTRTPIDHTNELAELCYANTIYLGPLSEDNAKWSISSFAERNQLSWDETTINDIIAMARTYPSFMRAACEAVADGCELHSETLRNHPAVTSRILEFLQSQPDSDIVKKCGLQDHPWLQNENPFVETEQLTAQEFRLLEALKNKTGELCSKDELIQAVWSEDRIYEEGLRDDSLAQLIRRLRKKVEVDPANPQMIQTIPGRGYLYRE